MPKVVLQQQPNESVAQTMSRRVDQMTSRVSQHTDKIVTAIAGPSERVAQAIAHRTDTVITSASGRISRALAPVPQRIDSFIMTRLNKLAGRTIQPDETFRISPEATAINDIFESAMKACMPDVNKTDINKQKFIAALDKLNKQVLVEFNAHKKNFTVDNCKSIANSALELATKVGAHTVQAKDVEVFVENTKQYRPNTTLFAVIAAVVSAVVGMLVGAGIGFAVGGPIGAIIGGSVGLATCGFFGGAASAYHNLKNDNLHQMANAAKDMAHESDAPVASMGA